jgi:hypothetical protein
MRELTVRCRDRVEQRVGEIAETRPENDGCLRQRATTRPHRSRGFFDLLECGHVSLNHSRD